MRPAPLARAASLLGLALAPLGAQEDLSRAMTEPNLDRRSELALTASGRALDAARKAWREGRAEEEAAALGTVRAGIDLCVQSLSASGKNPRRSPKYFKKAEIGLRHLLWRLDNFRIEKSVDERGTLEDLLKHANQVHERLLLDIMGNKKK